LGWLGTNQNGLTVDEEEKRMIELEQKMETLLREGYVGFPKRKLGF